MAFLCIFVCIYWVRLDCLSLVRAAAMVNLTQQIQIKIDKNCLLNEKTIYIGAHSRNCEDRLG